MNEFVNLQSKQQQQLQQQQQQKKSPNLQTQFQSENLSNINNNNNRNNGNGNGDGNGNGNDKNDSWKTVNFGSSWIGDSQIRSNRTNVTANNSKTVANSLHSLQELIKLSKEIDQEDEIVENQKKELLQNLQSF